MEELECVVIGAGFYGLAAAKQYHVQHPDQPMAVLDSASSIGGVWAEHRLYPGLKSNNLVGTYEYPDFPMDTPTFGVKPDEHIPGHVIHAYHEAYAKHFGFFDLCRFRTKVVSAEHKPEGGWILTLASGFDDQEPGRKLPLSRLSTRRLIVASGIASEPFMPHIEGQESYGAPLFHSKEFLQHADTVDPAKSRRVTILGGTKFAWDAAYAYGTKGVPVDWVIRASGHGACWMAPPYVTPFKQWIEKLANMRFLTWFSPCTWAEDGGYLGIRSFWHGTALGRAITNTFWYIMGADVIGLCKFDSHPEMAKLKPWTQVFHTGCSFSILNYDTDFFELIRSGIVKVHIADISHLSPHKVHLADEAKTVLDSDAFLCVSGWKHIPPLKFLPEGIEKELGLPHLPPKEPSPDDLASQSALFDRADKEILSRFPRLRDVPVFNKNYVPLSEQKAFGAGDADYDSDDTAVEVTPTTRLTPMLLYRFMTPPQPRFLRAKDVAFCGYSMNFSNAITAHIEGLWISAFFDGRLARDPSVAVAVADDDDTKDAAGGFRPTVEELQYRTVLHNRTGKWRYPTDYGEKYPDFIFDAVPYMDMLMADMGLQVHRKKGWFSEMTDPYGPEDYIDINDEWNRKFGANAESS